MKRLSIALLLLLGACGGATAPAFEDLPVGDPANGEIIYVDTPNRASPCSACHGIEAGAPDNLGPSLANYANVAGERVAGQSAELYTYNAIVNPAAHIVDGYPNAMPIHYGPRLEAQQLADIMAYILTLEEE